MTDDDLLMIEVQSGNVQAFNSLVDRHRGRLIGFFVKLTGDHHLAEDLAQDTLLKVYDNAYDYLPRGRFRAWMFRIGRNLRIDDVRRRQRDALLRAVHPDTADDPHALDRMTAALLPADTRLQRSEFQALIDQLLAELPDDQRQTFVLHHYSDLSLSEVAEIMEISVATSKSRLRLAREKLAEKLRVRGLTPLDERETE